jgi:hypothetical protein
MKDLLAAYRAALESPNADDLTVRHPPQNALAVAGGTMEASVSVLRKHARGAGVSGTVAVFAALIVGLGAIGLALAVPPAPSSVAASTGGSQFTPASVAVCNAPSYISSSSLLITLPSPVGTLASGGTLTATLQFAVNSSVGSVTGQLVTFPSVFVTFPLGSGSEQLDISPTSVAIAASGWTNAPSLNHSVKVASTLSFKAGSSVTLSTEKLAVMAPDNYTKLSLEFRWSWTLVQPNGTNSQSGWTVPTVANHLPSQLRSIFYPAPFVSFLSSTGASATIGTNYTATLGGDVAGRYFLLEMEVPGTGKVVQAQAQTAPASASTFTVYIPMLSYTDSLSPGSYLVHIHDACGAMLYNKTVKAVFAANATVNFTISPASCSAKFNGASWGNGTHDVVVPSIVPYSMSVGCSGHSFTSWSGGGGVHVNNGTSLLVSASGRFSVTYA